METHQVDLYPIICVQDDYSTKERYQLERFLKVVRWVKTNLLLESSSAHVDSAKV